MFLMFRLKIILYNINKLDTRNVTYDQNRMLKYYIYVYLSKFISLWYNIERLLFFFFISASQKRQKVR